MASLEAKNNFKIANFTSFNLVKALTFKWLFNQAST